MSGRDWVTRARQMYNDGYDAADFLPKSLDALEAVLSAIEAGNANNERALDAELLHRFGAMCAIQARNELQALINSALGDES